MFGEIWPNGYYILGFYVNLYKIDLLLAKQKL